LIEKDFQRGATLNGCKTLYNCALWLWARMIHQTRLPWGNLQGWVPSMERHRETRISCRKLFTAECYAWFTAGCVIEESQEFASANGFALTKGIRRLSKVPKRTHLCLGQACSQALQSKESIMCEVLRLLPAQLPLRVSRLLSAPAGRTLAANLSIIRH